MFQLSAKKTPSLRQLLADSKAEVSDLKRQIDELVSENHRLKSQGSGGGSSSGNESASHIHRKLQEVRSAGRFPVNYLCLTDCYMESRVQKLVQTSGELWLSMTSDTCVPC